MQKPLLVEIAPGTMTFLPSPCLQVAVVVENPACRESQRKESRLQVDHFPNHGDSFPFR